MPAITLQARFDAERIRLVEPFHLPASGFLHFTRSADSPGSGGSPWGDPYELLANALPFDAAPALTEEDAERADWYAFGLENLARAYGDDEPDYSEADLRP